MDFNLSPEQEMLKETARSFFSKECPKSKVREMIKDEKEYNLALWRKMSQLGWMGIDLSEDYGGYGGTLLDLAVLLEEMGRACLPGPFFSTAVLSKYIIVEAGNEEQKRNFLPKLASGEIIITVAINEESNGIKAEEIKASANLDKDAYILNGINLFVPDANISDYMVVSARSSGNAESRQGLVLFCMNSRSRGITINPLTTICEDKQCEVILEKVRVESENMLGQNGNGWKYIEKMLNRATIAKCAEMIGGAEGVLDLTVPYAKERNQFGRPIGSFQAIQHYLADMLMEVKGAKFITYLAAWKAAQGLSSNEEASMAKLWVSKAFYKVCQLSHKIHGAIGFTDEHDLHLYTKRAIMGELTLGDIYTHEEMIAKALGL